MLDDELIERWRLEQFTRMGFSLAQITWLMFWRVDLHEAERLIRRECPTDLAMRILEPVDVLVAV